MQDWYQAEAPGALATILERWHPPTAREGFRPAEGRLAARFPDLLRLVHGLYGWRYDFAWWLERLVGVTLAAADARDATLRVIDESSPDWVQDHRTVWAMTYTDRFAGGFSGLVTKVGHLRSLGITHLHLLPPYARPPGADDGGYAVSDYRSTHPPLGTIDDLRRAISDLRREGVGVVLDFVVNHTADDHPWAEAAKRGDSRYQARYLMFDDRHETDGYAPFLRSIFPDRPGDAFVWRPDVAGPNRGKWVWSTFYEFQWDLDYRNPDVLVAMAAELLFVINLGVAAVRMDATPFIWKRVGTSCENLDEAHQILQILDILVETVAPSVELLSEAIVHPDDVSRFVRPDECRLGYNPVIMSSIWEAMATRDTRLLRLSMSRRQRLPEGCRWLTYLRSHDDIGWGFADEDATELGLDPEAHRRFLNRFYSGAFPGSWARGLLFQENQVSGDARISGTPAGLAGLEAAEESADPEEIALAVSRILAGYVVMSTAAGIPLVYLGDEIGQVNDGGYLDDPHTRHDNRWTHRPRFDWDRLHRLEVETGPTSRLLGELRRLLRLRGGLEGLAGTDVLVTEQPGPGVIGYTRGGGTIEILVNLADTPQPARLYDDGYDLWGDRPAMAGPLLLAPYQAMIVTRGTAI